MHITMRSLLQEKHKVNILTMQKKKKKEIASWQCCKTISSHFELCASFLPYKISSMAALSCVPNHKYEVSMKDLGNHVTFFSISLSLV